MNREKDILEELRNMGSPLAGVPRNMPFCVPTGYFDHLSASLIDSVNDLEKARGWSKSMPFSIPDGYFENLAENLVASAFAGDSSGGFTKELPYKTPPGYFDQLPAQVLAAAKTAVKPAKTAKVIPLSSPGIFFRRVQFAAAAIFILFMSAGAYITFFSDRSSNPEKILASVPNNEIDDYLQHTYRLDADRIVGNNDINNLQLDNKEIIQYLNETGWDVIE